MRKTSQPPVLSGLLDLDSLVPHSGTGRDRGRGRTVLLFLAGLAIALLVDFLLLIYLLTRLPRVHPGRRAVVVPGLIGAGGFELLKLPLTGYLQGVAVKTMDTVTARGRNAEIPQYPGRAKGYRPGGLRLSVNGSHRPG
ncbi:hypothetical protein [Streptomyces sp. NPDC002851]